MVQITSLFVSARFFKKTQFSPTLRSLLITILMIILMSILMSVGEILKKNQFSPTQKKFINKYFNGHVNEVG